MPILERILRRRYGPTWIDGNDWQLNYDAGGMQRGV